MPYGSDKTADEHCPERGLLVDLLPVSADDENHTGNRTDLERAVDLREDGACVDAEEGSDETEHDERDLGESELLLVGCILVDKSNVEVAGQGGGDGQQECGSGGENSCDDSHGSQSADCRAEGIGNGVEDGSCFCIGVHDLAEHTDECGEECEDDNEDSSGDNAGVSDLLGLGTVNVCDEGGGQDEREHAAGCIADDCAEGRLGNAEVVCAESLTDYVEAADIVPCEDADDNAADVKNGCVDDVHCGDALEADKTLNDEDDAHDPGHCGQINIEHRSEDSAGCLGLHCV